MIKVKLSEICDLQNGYAFKSSDYVENSNTLSCRMSNIRLGGIFDIEYNPRFLPDSFADQYKGFLLKDGDLVIAMTDLANDPKLLGVPTLVQTDGRNILLNQRVGKLIIKDSSKVDNKYLQHVLNDPKTREYYRKFASGGLQINLGKSDLLNVEIPLPPLAEQRRIASILDQADDLRQKRQQAIEKLDQLLQATFIDMFGDPVSNPKGWEIFKSKALFQDSPRIGTTTPANGQGIPVVRVGELGQFYIDFDKCGRVQISESDFKKYELKNGDLVLARAIGSKNQLGKCSYFSEYFEPVCIDSHVMRLRPDPKKMHPLWFYFLLSSDQGKKILQSKGGATAVQFNINSAQANDLDIALPPLSEQAKFVEIANKILKNKDSHIKSLEKNNLLFSALQNQAFNGTL